MSTPLEFYQKLQNMEPGTITMSPGPFRIGIGPADAMAAKLILWLLEQLPDDVTTGNFLEVLDCARWWTVYWAGVHDAEQIEGEKA